MQSRSDDLRKPIKNADEVTAHILVLAANCVEDHPWDLTTQTQHGELVDALSDTYGFTEGWRIVPDTPAARKVVKHARVVQRQMA